VGELSLDAAMDTDPVPHEVPRHLSFTSQLSTSNPDFTSSGLKSHFGAKSRQETQGPRGPLPPLAPSLHPFSAPVAPFSRLSYSHQNSRKIGAN